MMLTNYSLNTITFEGKYALRKLEELSIQGKCFTNETNFIFFTKPEEKISLVYGKNGSRQEYYL